MSYRVSEYKIKPSPEQEKALLGLLKRSRECYNDLLQERRDHYQSQVDAGILSLRSYILREAQSGRIDLVDLTKGAPEKKRNAALKLPQKRQFNALYSLLRSVPAGKALLQRITEKEKSGEIVLIKYLDYYSQKPLHKCREWQIPSRVYEAALERLDNAYNAFFSGVKTGGRRAGLPETARAHEWNSLIYAYAPDAIDTQTQTLKLSRDLKIPVLLYRAIPGPYKSLTVLKRPSGWYVQLKTRVEPKTLEATGKEVGVDMGVAYLCVDTDGHIEEHPSALACNLDRLKEEQRKLSRTQFHPIAQSPTKATLCLCSRCGAWNETDPMKRGYRCGECGLKTRRETNSRANHKRFLRLPMRPDLSREEVVDLYRRRLKGIVIHNDDPGLRLPEPEEAHRPSKRRIRQRKVVARLHERVAMQRKAALHRISRYYIRNYDRVVVENLETAEMLSDPEARHLNLKMADASLSMLRQYLLYKGGDAGREVTAVAPAGMTRLCSLCGELTQTTYRDRTMKCPSCGGKMMRQYNSARNALKLKKMGIPDCIRLPELSIMYKGWLKSQP